MNHLAVEEQRIEKSMARSKKKSGPYEDRTHDLRVISTAL